MRVPGRPDLPPFIAIDHFWVDAGPVHDLEAARRHRPSRWPEDRCAAVGGPAGHARGRSRRDAAAARIESHRRAPGDARRRAEVHSAPSGQAAAHVQDPRAERSTISGSTAPSPSSQNSRIRCRQAWSKRGGHVWAVAPRRPDRDTASPASTRLTNADLSTINGIGGILQSSGNVRGPADRRSTRSAKSQTPDFSLDLGGKPVPLETRFHTVVDGTDGSTRLVRVDAQAPEHARSPLGAPSPTCRAPVVTRSISNSTSRMGASKICWRCRSIRRAAPHRQRLAAGHNSRCRRDRRKVRRRLLIAGTFALARGAVHRHEGPGQAPGTEPAQPGQGPGRGPRPRPHSHEGHSLHCDHGALSLCRICRFKCRARPSISRGTTRSTAK